MKKWPKSRKKEPVYPALATTFHNIYSNISLCMGYPSGELLVLGWELLFQALCNSSTFLKAYAFKGLQLYALHFHGLTLEFEVHASKQRLG